VRADRIPLMYLSGSKWNVRRKRPRLNVGRLVLLVALIAGAVYVERFLVPTVPPLFVPTATPTRSPATYALEAESFFQAGKLGQAEQSYRQAIEANPQDADLYVALARVLVFSERWDEAETQARNALLIDPDLAAAHAILGWALDFHSRYDGDVASRSAIGELVFRYKYGDEHQLARDLAERWAELLASQPELPKFDAVIPVPPSTRRDFDPVSNLAQALAVHLKVPVLVNVLIKTRVTQPQKEMKSLAQKQANVAGAFALKSSIRGQRVILLDDLYDSGATLEEAARVLARGGAAGIIVLTLTRTIHSDA